MSISKDTRPNLAAVITPEPVIDVAQEVERAAYRAAASVAVLWRLLLDAGDDDCFTVPAAVLADFVEGIDRELDFVTDHIGSMHLHDSAASQLQVGAR